MTSTLRQEFARSPDGEGNWTVNISNTNEWNERAGYEYGGLKDWPISLPYYGMLRHCPSNILDHKFDEGRGAPERPLYVVWTPRFIIVPTEYEDGATGVAWYPRNPTPEGTHQ